MDQITQCNININNSDYIAYSSALDSIFSIANIANITSVTYDKNIHLSSHIKSIESQIQKIKYYMVLSYLQSNRSSDKTNIETLNKEIIELKRLLPLVCL